VPARVWEAWFRPAWDRREKRRTGGTEGARRRWHPDRETDSEWATHWVSQSESQYQSSKQAIKPSVTPSPGDATDDVRTPYVRRDEAITEAGSLVETLHSMGLPAPGDPPAGTP
jgi:hypothetical protein